MSPANADEFEQVFVSSLSKQLLFYEFSVYMCHVVLVKDSSTDSKTASQWTWVGEKIWVFLRFLPVFHQDCGLPHNGHMN